MSRLRYFHYFFIMAVFILLSNAEENYCGICSDHTMCVYHNEGASCNAKLYGLTPQQKNQIVNVHNKYRQDVASGNEKRGNPGPQPPAKNMPKLVWDDELARVAQRWANQCRFDHDKCRNVPRFPVGQNVATQWTTDPIPEGMEELVKLWYEEVALFDSHQVEYVTNFNGVGHYTQMLWAKSTTIGCGFVNYQQGIQNTVLLICNYGPAGNYINDKMYEIRR